MVRHPRQQEQEQKRDTEAGTDAGRPSFWTPSAAAGGRSLRWLIMTISPSTISDRALRYDLVIISKVV